MSWFFIALAIVAIAIWWSKREKKPNLKVLPEKFVVFDLETTGLDDEKHEIIEIGAIRVSRDSNMHDSFQGLIKPKKKVPKKITELTGITQVMLDEQGETLDEVLRQFRDFIGDLPLVAFNADFDIGFLSQAIDKVMPSQRLDNSVSCALDMARRAWPGRKSYRLASLAKDGGLSLDESHRALGDCKRALIVYTAAASRLGRAS